MPENKTKLNPNRVAFAVLSLLMLVFLIWAVRKCGGDDSQYAMLAEQKARAHYLDSLQRAEDSLAIVGAAQAEAEARAAAIARAATQPLPGDSVVMAIAPQVIQEEVTRLFVTFDGLNVRSGPGLNYGKIDRLKLFDEVIFLGETTDSSYQINLGEITPDEPWVKIKTASNKEGWVYGAGVSYYKKRLEGVEN